MSQSRAPLPANDEAPETSHGGGPLRFAPLAGNGSPGPVRLLLLLAASFAQPLLPACNDAGVERQGSPDGGQPPDSGKSPEDDTGPGGDDGAVDPADLPDGGGAANPCAAEATTKLTLCPGCGTVSRTDEAAAGAGDGGWLAAELQCDGAPFPLAGGWRVLRLHLDEPGPVRLELRAGWDGVRAALLDAACSPAALACAPAAGRHELGELPAGDHYLVVGGGAPGQQGAFTIALSQGVPGYELPGSCLEPLQLALMDGTGQQAATLRGADDQGRGSCSAAGSPDSVHVLAVQQPGLYRFRLQTEGGWSGRLHLRSVCGNPDSELGCSGAGQEELLAALNPGQIFIFAEAAGLEGGEYRLEVSRLPDGDGESCDSRGLIILGPERKASVEGDLSGALPHLDDGFCGSAGTGDHIYALLLRERAALRFELEAEGQATVSLRSSCAEAGEAEHCTVSGVGALVTDLLEPGDYSVVVRSYAGEYAGAYTLGLEAIPAGRAPGNDRCDAARPIEVSMAMQSAFGEGNNIGAADDLQGSCGGAGAPDVVFLLHLDAESHLSFVLQATFDGVLYLRPACEEPEGELVCLPAGWYQELRHVPAGDYYLVVDGTSRGAWGDFRFDIGVVEALPRPTNDDCAQALPLPDLAARGHAEVEVDLFDASDSGSASCGGWGGADVIYRLDFPQETMLTVLEDSYNYPVLYLRQGACDGPEVGCGQPQLVVPRLAAGTYYLFVDSSWSIGRLRIFLTAQPAQPLPVNDRCEQAEEVRLDAQGRGSFSGETTAGTNDSAGSCGGGAAPELFYRFHLEQASQVFIDVETWLFGWDGLVYLLGACGAGAPTLACQDDPEELTLARLEPGDYWLAVDGFSQARGPFTGTITTTPFGPPGPGESCEEALPAVLDPAAGALQLTGDLADGTGGLADQACLGLQAQDRIHLLHLAQGGRYELTLHGAGSVVGSFRLACADPASGFCLGRESPIVRELPAGDYYFVARAPARGGALPATPYELELRPLPAEQEPPGAGCDRAIVLDSSPGRYRVVGTTVGAPHRRDGGCGGGAAGEVVYSLELPYAAHLRASLTAHDFDGLLYLSSRADCAAGPAMTCGGWQQEHLLEPGSYSLFVDGATAGSTGDFALVLELHRLAAAGEPCDPDQGGCLPGLFCVTPEAGADPLCVSPDPAEQVLWAADLDSGKLLRLHPATGEPLEQLDTPAGIRGPACGLALDPDGRVLLVDGGNPALGIQVLDPWSGELIEALPNPASGGAAGLGRSPGELVLLDGTAGLLRVLAPEDGAEIITVALPAADEYGGLEVDGNLALVTLRQDGGWLLHGLGLHGDVEPQSLYLTGGPYPGAARAGGLLFLIDGQGTLRLLDPFTLAELGTLPGAAQLRPCGLAGR